MSNLEQSIEDAIRQTLLITNEAGVKYAVKRIMALIAQENLIKTDYLIKTHK